MSSVAEINQDRQWLRWKATSIEWLSVIIACASTVIALLSMFICAICISMVISQERHIEDLSGDIDVYRIRAAKLDAYLKAKGTPIEEIYNE